MAKHNPRIISGLVEEAAVREREKAGTPRPFSEPIAPPKPKTRAEEVYDLIDEACSYCWRFTDAEGRPWIQKEDVEDKGNGLFLVRFRCSVLAMVCTTQFERMAREVCKRLCAKLRYAFVQREERYIGDIKASYDECIWVIQEGEVDAKPQEEVEEEDEAPAVDIGERFDEVMANFV